MITLKQIKDCFKGLNYSVNYYIGKLDNKKECSIGLYNLNTSRKPVVAIGGLDNSSYSIKSVSMLIHWSSSPDETEQKAYEIYDRLQRFNEKTIGNSKVCYLELLCPEPIYVGTDDNNIYEYVIEFNIYYERIDD